MAVAVVNPLDDFLTTIQSDEGEHRMTDEDVLRCLNGPDGCVGAVELRWPGYGERTWPRCEKHGEQRIDREEKARERYPDSDIPPRDFDPSYAGERWNEED